MAKKCYRFVDYSEISGADPIANIPKFCREARRRLGNLNFNNYPSYGLETKVVISCSVHKFESGTFLDSYPEKNEAEAKVILATNEWKDHDTAAAVSLG